MRTNPQRQIGSVATLLTAVLNGDDEQVKALLASGVDVNGASPDGWTPLMHAAMVGQAQIVRLLIDAGADVNAQAVDGRTALMTAELWGHTEVVKALFASGADPHLEDVSGWMAGGRDRSGRGQNYDEETH